MEICFRATLGGALAESQTTEKLMEQNDSVRARHERIVFVGSKHQFSILCITPQVIAMPNADRWAKL
jgi:hypothetical protein